MSTYSDHAQRELDQQSGEELDRRAMTVSPYVAEAAAKVGIKLCRDCVFFRASDGKCTKETRLDYISGEASFYYADTQRQFRGCGHDAKWFESLEELRAHAREKGEAERYGDTPGDDE